MWEVTAKLILKKAIDMESSFDKEYRIDKVIVTTPTRQQSWARGDKPTSRENGVNFNPRMSNYLDYISHEMFPRGSHRLGLNFIIQISAASFIHQTPEQSCSQEERIT